MRWGNIRKNGSVFVTVAPKENIQLDLPSCLSACTTANHDNDNSVQLPAGKIDT